MATTPNAVTDTQATADLQPTTMDWAVVVKTDKDGEKYLSAFQYTKESELQKYKDDDTLVGVQTFGTFIPLTDEGIKQILPDLEQRTTCFWNGMKSSLLGPRIRRKLEESTRDENTKQLDAKFNFVEGIYDTTDLIREDAKRKNLSPQEKIIKNLRGIPGFENLPETVLLQMYENMKSSLPQQMVSDIESSEETSEKQEVTA